jgi:hypothetical protein
MIDFEMEKHEVKATIRKLKGGFSIRPDGKFLLTPDAAPEAHYAFWAEFENQPMNRNEID